MTSTTSTTQDIPAMLANMSAASLFVGELLPHVNEVILYKKFAPMGTVTSVKLCRDWVTGKSLCYAYVNFENPAEAEKAYRSLNYELLEGHPMRIMKSTRNPWLQKDGDCSCYHHHCCGSGTKGFIDAKTFVEAIENYSAAFKNLAIQDCGEAKAPTGYKYSSEFLKRMNIANNRFTNVFIKNFKDLLDDFKLWKLCKQFGEVTSAKVMVDEYGISKGFGFASFTDSDAAQRAVNKLNGLVLDGRTLYAGPAITKTQRQRDSNVRYDNDDHKTEWRHNSLNSTTSPRIRIRNLRDVVDEVRLRKEFERFGPVIQTELLKTCDGRSKGTGYVVYQDQQDATKAVVSMHGKVIYGTRISVTYAPFNTTPTATNTAPEKSPTPTTNGNTTSVSGGGNNSSNTTNDGDNNGNKNFLQFKDLVSTLANKGHPVNINDITTFNSNSVNRNSRQSGAHASLTKTELPKPPQDAAVSSTERIITRTFCSNNTENINISNNAILARSTRKVADVTEATENGDVDNGNDLKQAEEDSGDDTTSTSATLSVKNLDESISDEKLESLFSVYGHVLSAKVISNEFGVSKGFGFVIMSDAQDAVRAIKNLDGRIVVNRPIYVAPTVHARLVTKM